MAVRSQELVDVQNALDAESSEYPDYFSFVVDRVLPEAGVFKTYVKTGPHAPHSLDDSVEGARAWWPGTPPGTGDVLSVVPEEQQINIRFAARPPVPNGPIRLYVPRYLDCLKSQWEDDSLSSPALEWLRKASEGNRFEPSLADAPPSHESLRPRQREAFQLSGWNVGILWGPPGTGKTHTLGALLANYIAAHPAARVLLMSTTNTAVDQALVSVDRALARGEVHDSRFRDARDRCVRLGSRVSASAFIGREHLLPVRNEALLRRLAELEVNRPDVSDVGPYAAWKRDQEILQEAMRADSISVLQRSRLVALTTTRATFTRGILATFAPYDLLVLDEGSQVPVAMAAMLAPLARRMVVAGDPQQLAPIVRSKRDDCGRWFGESLFRLGAATPSAVCQLTEQSRMSSDICRVVSRVFYTGTLVVAPECPRNPAWHSARAVHTLPSLGNARTIVAHVAQEAVWSRHYGGPVRSQSADLVVATVQSMVALQEPESLLVLTPFRAQRTLIRNRLRKQGLGRVHVSTVHRAQGSERHSIIFDPVDGGSPFLQTPDAARLFNVAVSRAQARLVVTLSPRDLEHPVLRQIAELIGFRKSRPATTRFIPLVVDGQLSAAPESLLGKLVMLGDTTGRLEGIDGGCFILTDTETGRQKKFKTATWLSPDVRLPQSLYRTPKKTARRETASERVSREAGEFQFQNRVATLLAGIEDRPSAPPPILDSQSRSNAVVPASTPQRQGSPHHEEVSILHAPLPAGHITGRVSVWLGDSVGTIQGDDGKAYHFRYLDIAPALKLRGLSVGTLVHFRPVVGRRQTLTAFKIAAAEER